MKTPCITSELQCSATQRKFFLDLTKSARYVMIITALSSSKWMTTNVINQYQITESYSKSRSSNLCIRLCNCVIGHDMLPLKNFNFPSFWKGWKKWSDCLWPSKGKWNKNSWVGQGDESCYSLLIKKGQRARLQELGQLSGSKAISSALDSYPNPLKWALVLAKARPNRSQQKTGVMFLEIFY